MHTIPRASSRDVVSKGVSGLVKSDGTQVGDTSSNLVPWNPRSAVASQDVPIRMARFVCEKCGTTDYSTSEIRTCSGVVAKILNVQNRRFLTVTCEGCGHTQMWETVQSVLANLADVVVR